MALKKEPDDARARLAPLLAERATLVLGPSGAGKSTLVNLMVADAKAQIGEISQALNTGRHTTTATQWYWLDGARSAALIDSPGFQEFGLRHIETGRLAALMPDIGAHASACRFYNCSHLHEPGCGVLGRARSRRDRRVALPHLPRDLRRAVAWPERVRCADRLADQVGERQQRQQQHPEDDRAPDQADDAAQVAGLRRDARRRAFGGGRSRRRAGVEGLGAIGRQPGRRAAAEPDRRPRRPRRRGSRLRSRTSTGSRRGASS